MVDFLQKKGYWVRGVDWKYPEFNTPNTDHFVCRDLRSARDVDELVGYAGCLRNPNQTFNREFDEPFDEIYQLACQMGGAGFVFSGNNDAEVMHDSVIINANVLEAVKKHNEKTGLNKTKIFFSSSACIYPQENQIDPDNPNCEESTAYPANPDSEYGFEKLFSERMYFAYNRNHNIPVRVARYHNIMGPKSCYDGGREKSPAAICRKVIKARDSIEIWGDGKQTRSYLYIDDCLEATYKLMESNFSGPVNIGSEEQVSINQLVDLACSFEGKKLKKIYISGPQGVRGRNSDNRLIEKELNWTPKLSLEQGLRKLYFWIKEQIENESRS